MTDGGADARLAFVFIGDVLALADRLLFALLSARWQLLPMKLRAQMKIHAVSLVDKAVEPSRTPRLGFKAEVFMTFSERVQRQTQLLKRGFVGGKS